MMQVEPKFYTRAELEKIMEKEGSFLHGWKKSAIDSKIATHDDIDAFVEHLKKTHDDSLVYSRAILYVLQEKESTVSSIRTYLLSESAKASDGGQCCVFAIPTVNHESDDDSSFLVATIAVQLVVSDEDSIISFAEFHNHKRIVALINSKSKTHLKLVSGK